MKALLYGVVASVAMTMTLPGSFAYAGSILGGSGGLLSVNGGEASNESLVNVGIGGGGSDSGNVLDVNLGGNDPLATASISTGGSGSSGGLLDGGLAADLGVDLRGLGLDVDLGVGVGLGLGGSGGSGGNGGNDGGGNGGAGGVGSGGSHYASLGGAASACSLAEGRQVLAIAAQARVTSGAIASWARAANVRIVPVTLCTSTRAQVARVLAASPKIQSLRGAVAADALISASLARSRHDAGDVYAVSATGGMLTIYVL